MRPALTLHERGRARDEQQFADLVRKASRDRQRQLGANRPACEHTVFWQTRANLFYGVSEISAAWAVEITW